MGRKSDERMVDYMANKFSAILGKAEAAHEASAEANRSAAAVNRFELLVRVERARIEFGEDLADQMLRDSCE